MPITLTEADPRRGSDWPVPEMPTVSKEPWAGVDAFWKEEVLAKSVNQDRTNRLPDNDVLISISAGNSPWKGVSYGMPFHLVRDGDPTTPVWDLSRSITWKGLKPTYPIVNVPLPAVVRREGDPGGEFDRHAFFYDPDNQVLWESMQIDNPNLFGIRVNRLKTLGKCDWAAGYDNGRGIRGGGIIRWDCKRPWDGLGQPIGRVATGIPQFPLITRWDEIEAGVINHALFLALPNYAPEMTGPAKGTDGNTSGHPLRGGERLRLRSTLLGKFDGPALVIAKALVKYGCILGDTSPIAGFTVTQDRRWQKLGKFELNLSDFEVV